MLCGNCCMHIVLVHYSVQPYPIYYPDETADVIYFDGSTIEFTCKYFCEHDCDSQVYYKTRDKSFCLVDENLCEAPFDFNITYHPGYPANVTVKITNANVSSAGSYQCLTPAWHTTYVINKETNFQMAGKHSCTCSRVLYNKGMLKRCDGSANVKWHDCL